MRPILSCVLGLAAAVALAVSAPGFAQPPKDKGKAKDDKKAPQFEGPVALLKDKAVQKDLKLTPKQIQQVAGLDKAATAMRLDDREKYLTATGDPKRITPAVTYDQVFAEQRRVEAKVALAVLTPEQQKRFTGIRWQKQGPMVVTGVAGFVGGPMDLEKELIAALALTAKQQQEVTGLLSANVLDKTAPPWKDVREKFEALLTDEQKAKWKEALGEPLAAAK